MTNYVIEHIKEGDFNSSRNIIKKSREKNHSKKIGFRSFDDDLNRKILEKEKVDIFVPILQNRKDFSKQRDSGLDKVMAKESFKKKIIIGIDINEIENLSGKKKAEVISRIKQNINLCKKNKVKMIFVNSEKKDLYDLKALGLTLGMPTWMVKNFN